MKIGIIKETKTPPDTRVPLTPIQCKYINDNFSNIKVVVQKSESRCYTDNEYLEQGIDVVDNVSDCAILMGVKEVKIPFLIDDKQYFFFSHTIKKQAYNRSLLQEVLKKKIQLCDYETLTDDNGKRVIAFGRWAGIVGAHNGIKTWGKRNERFDLKAMYQCYDFNEAKSYYSTLDLKGLKVVLTGTGRVSCGSAEVLDLMNIKKLEAEDFLTYTGTEPVYCMLATEQLFARDSDNGFDNDFYKNPVNYHSILKPYLSKANVLINGIYWDNKAPALFSKDEMRNEDFTIQVIADITCDIAPVASIPSTLKAATIAEPVFGYNPLTEEEDSPYQKHVVDMMTVDNLPNELPRDASEDFGNQFIKYVLPELLKANSNMIYKASITTKEGVLNEPYLYLQDYVNGL